MQWSFDYEWTPVQGKNLQLKHIISLSRKDQADVPEHFQLYLCFNKLTTALLTISNWEHRGGVLGHVFRLEHIFITQY
jgi:hypothetical protein